MGKFDVAPDYVKDHYLKEDRLAVVLINREKGTTQTEIRTAEEIVSDRYQAHLRASNAHGADVYISVNSLKPEATGRTKDEIDAIRHVYLDIDANGKETLDRVLKTEGMPTPHAVMETSPGKFQALWQVEGFDKQQAEQLVRGMAAEHNADQAVWDSARILRLPGFRNCKYDEPHYVKLVDTGKTADRIYRPEDFPQVRQAPEVTPERPQFGHRAPGKAVGGNGSQSDHDYAYACRKLEQGWEPGVIAQKIAQFRRDNPDLGQRKPDLLKYAERTVRSAQARVITRPMQPVERPQSHDRYR